MAHPAIFSTLLAYLGAGHTCAFRCSFRIL